MKRMITITFKDGNNVTVDPRVDCFGLVTLGNGMFLNLIHGTLYKEKGNIICGEDITDQVDTIEVCMKY